MKRLYRSVNEKLIGGFCGGLGRYLNVDPVIIRLIFIFAAFFNGIGIIIYILGILIVPQNPDEMGKKDDTTNGFNYKDTFFWGIVLVVVGAFLLIREMGWLYWEWFQIDWYLIIAISLIILGLYLIWGYKFGEENSTPSGKWYKLSSDKMILGVCAGLADYYHIDISLMRMAWVLAGFFSHGLLIVVYLVMAAILPEKTVVEYEANTKE